MVKRVCTPTLLKTIFSLAKKYGVQTIVDPKGADWSKYNVCYMYYTECERTR